MGDKDVIQAILYYQQCLDKYTRRNDEERVLYCLSKLYKMPISIEHLQETGVGRTVNALRKLNGEIAEAAKTLVSKWKEMVTADNEDDESKDASKSESVKKNENETKDKSYKEKNSSSHSHSDKKKSRSMSVNDKNSKHSSNKTKEDTQTHKDHESRVKKKKEKHSKHNSSRRKRESSVESNLEESDCESKHRESSESSSEEKEIKQERHKRKERKPDSSDTGDESQECSKSKKKKYLVSDESEEEPRKHSYKSSKHRHENKEKAKYIHKKNEDVSRDKRKKKDDTKSKEKHSSKSSSNGTNKKSKSPEIVSKHLLKQSSTKHKSRKSTSEKPSTTMGASGIDSGSGASFAEALGMLIPSSSKSVKKKVAVVHPRTVDNPTSYSRELSPEVLSTKVADLLSPKKLAPLDINLDNLLPEITPHYKPLGLPLDNGMSRNKLSSEDETLSAIMYNKISRTKVYSGNKVTWGKVPTLFEICTRVLQDNIDALEYTGGVPYLILKPVIERANPNQLFLLEHHNPYLVEETDELWQLHCNKLFRTKIREEMETWRDMYLRCFDERETKLKALTANIKQSQDKSLPVRQTKLAYVDSIVKPPRNVARKQAKHGTGGTEKKPMVTPSSRLSTLATSGAAGQVSVPNPGVRAVNSTGSSPVVKPKKAPLMQKTLALMKSRIFRR